MGFIWKFIPPSIFLLVVFLMIAKFNEYSISIASVKKIDENAVSGSRNNPLQLTANTWTDSVSGGWYKIKAVSDHTVIHADFDTSFRYISIPVSGKIIKEKIETSKDYFVQVYTYDFGQTGAYRTLNAGEKYLWFRSSKGATYYIRVASADNKYKITFNGSNTRPE
jgi:hypothetical protein